MAQELTGPPFTLRFDAFWQWVANHPNCILRVGTSDVVLYDDDDLHWNFAKYDGGMLGCQVLCGKRFIGELFVDPEQVAYVQTMQGEVEGEYTFELISETETDRTLVYFFVMAHGYEDEIHVPPGQVH